MPSEYLSQNEIAAATLVQSKDFNAQLQPKIAWPAKFGRRARLSRSAGAVESDSRGTGRGRQDGTGSSRRSQRSASDKNASGVAGQLDALASDLDRDASSASGIDAAHLRQLAAVLKDRAQKLR